MYDAHCELPDTGCRRDAKETRFCQKKLSLWDSQVCVVVRYEYSRFPEQQSRLL